MLNRMTKDQEDGEHRVEEDPFDLFDDSDDDDDNNDDNNSSSGSSINNDGGLDDRRIRTETKSNEHYARDESCGVMSFHFHTEQALLLHVRRALDVSVCNRTGDLLPLSLAQRVLKAMDEFCMEKHWMMHIGPEKGTLICNELEESYLRYLRDMSQLDAGDNGRMKQVKKRSFTILELGTYCGYSSILFGNKLKIMAEKASISSELTPRIITVEVDEGHAKVARELIKLSNLHDIVTVVVEDDCTVLVENTIKPVLLSSQSNGIDFLFIDHDKDLYLDDYLELERHNCLKVGSTIIADNVLFAGITNYVSHMKEKQERKESETKTLHCTVEYSLEEEKKLGRDCVKDGIEVTRLLKIL